MPVQYTTQLWIENISILLINKINSKKTLIYFTNKFNLFNRKTKDYNKISPMAEEVQQYEKKKKGERK